MLIHIVILLISSVESPRSSSPFLFIFLPLTRLKEVDHACSTLALKVLLYPSTKELSVDEVVANLKRSRLKEVPIEVVVECFGPCQLWVGGYCLT